MQSRVDLGHLELDVDRDDVAPNRVTGKLRAVDQLAAGCIEFADHNRVDVVADDPVRLTRAVAMNHAM